MLLSGGEFTPFITRPISGTLFTLIAVSIVWQFLVFFYQARRKS